MGAFQLHAMVLEQPGKPLVWQVVPDPVPSSGQVLIKVLACAVCRTDLHVCDGELPDPKLPLIPGHEIVGVIIAVGADVKTLHIGDRVGVAWLGSTCGACDFCLRGEETCVIVQCLPAISWTEGMPN